ncbi:hypothetical protein M3916_003211 [Vibrio parahaemolyticus]|uniref:hypothetical protein n=1 Tax=Vibrio parahaemolyticus TaxID=670 RepID=UPI00084AE15E|nr:hypothetical protein [Vibrio parahaemolyticus]EJE4163092.1 hypothetical protein [Vibrio parahaemolyticus]OEA17213.1 hypothetical protein BBM55_12310 [Vibrio parahaemolyticus]
MKKVIIGLVVALASLSALAGEGVVTVASTHSAKDTADNFVAIAQEKGSSRISGNLKQKR